MKTEAALLWGVHEDWKVEEVDLDPPKAGEVLVKLAASGLCHSDEHLRTGDIPIPFPVVGGHEGAGVIQEVGLGVTSVQPGDHVVLAFVPSCGTCRYCATGQSNLCDLGASIILGPALDGTYRFHARGEDVGQMCILGTFSPYTVVSEASVVKIDEVIPLHVAALVGCGVTTGIGSATRSADVRPGDTVVVMGVGGIGANVVQGARMAGATNIVAIDPVAFKRKMAQKLGATDVASSVDEAWDIVSRMTHGQLADSVVITTDVAEGRYIAQALSLVGKGGRVVVTSIGHPEETSVDMSLFELTLYEKQVRGALFGSGNPRVDIPRVLRQYQRGQVKLDELITTTYKLDDINQGFADMLNGTNIRGVVLYD